MTGAVIAVQCGDPAMYAAWLMRDGSIDDVAVLDGTGTIVATVSGRDPLRPLLLAP